MSDGIIVLLMVLAVCGFAALVTFGPGMVRAFQRWHLLIIANDPVRMRARSKRELEKESLKQKRKDEKRFEKKIAETAEALRDNGKASTEIKTVAEWFKEREYNVEPPIGNGGYYKITIPDVTDKELSDIILGESK